MRRSSSPDTLGKDREAAPPSAGLADRLEAWVAEDNYPATVRPLYLLSLDEAKAAAAALRAASAEPSGERGSWCQPSRRIMDEVLRYCGEPLPTPPAATPAESED